MQNIKLATSKSIGAFIIVSLAYIASYTITSGFISPIQDLILPNIPVAGMLFLPHGVRILAAYYYGWKALPILLPSMYLMWFVDVYGNGVPINAIHPLISGICCVVAVKLASGAFKGILEKEWKLLLVAGLIGSILSSLIMSLIINMNFFNITVFHFVFGDMAGQLALMIMLIYLFRFSRMIKN